MKARAVSIFHKRIDNTYELLNRRAAEIFEACEHEIQLERPASDFRSSITGAIRLACETEHNRQAGESREVLPTVPPVTVHEYKELNRVLSRKEREYKAFDLLVKCLASAYWHATRKRPTTSYSVSDAQGHGAFWHLVETVLPVACEIAVAGGIKFPYPLGVEARAKKIGRILKGRKHLYLER